MISKAFAITGIWRLLWIVLSAPLLLSGCVASKVEERLSEGVIARQGEVDSLLEEIQSDTQKPISWEEAHRRMVSDNLGLQQSRQSLVQSERETKRQWLSLVPRMAARGSIR
jgi:hypothetical protein